MQWRGGAICQYRCSTVTSVCRTVQYTIMTTDPCKHTVQRKVTPISCIVIWYHLFVSTTINNMESLYKVMLDIKILRRHADAWKTETVSQKNYHFFKHFIVMSLKSLKLPKVTRKRCENEYTYQCKGNNCQIPSIIVNNYQNTEYRVNIITILCSFRTSEPNQKLPPH